MESRGISAPGSTESMVAGIERFARNSPLNGDELSGVFNLRRSVERRTHVAVKRNILVHAPTGRTMVYDNMMERISANIVISLSAYRHTAANTYVADNNIISIDVQCSCNANTIAGSRLSRNGNVGMIDVQVLIDFDSSRYTENHNTRTFGLKGCAQAARTAIVQIGYGNHLATTSAGSKHSGTPCSRKSGNHSLGQSGRMRGHLSRLRTYTLFTFLCLYSYSGTQQGKRQQTHSK